MAKTVFSGGRFEIMKEGEQFYIAAGGKQKGGYYNSMEAAVKQAKQWVEEKKLGLSHGDNDGAQKEIESRLAKLASQKIPTTWSEYEKEVEKLENKGMTTSDAQGAVDSALIQAGYDPNTLKKK